MSERTESQIRTAAEWRQDGDHQWTDVRYETTEDGIAKITITRPEVHNAFRPQTIIQIGQALEVAREDESVGAIILAGEGDRAFCSGGDQRIRGKAGYQYETEGHVDAGAAPNPIDKAKLGRLHILECQRLIRFMPKIVICLVNGWAAGGGHSLHVVADLTHVDATFLDQLRALLRVGVGGEGAQLVGLIETPQDDFGVDHWLSPICRSRRARPVRG